MEGGCGAAAVCCGCVWPWLSDAVICRCRTCVPLAMSCCARRATVSTWRCSNPSALSIASAQRCTTARLLLVRARSTSNANSTSSNRALCDAHTSYTAHSTPAAPPPQARRSQHAHSSRIASAWKEGSADLVLQQVLGPKEVERTTGGEVR